MIYKCEICGKEYENANEAFECEKDCSATKEAEEAKACAEEEAFELAKEELISMYNNVLEAKKEVAEAKAKYFDIYDIFSEALTDLQHKYNVLVRYDNNGIKIDKINAKTVAKKLSEIYKNPEKLFNRKAEDFPEFKGFWL